MEFEGLVIQLLAQAKGVSARGEWVKQEVIFEQTGEFGRKVCVSFWGDKAQDAAALKPGEKVKVSVNIESREYNGRWYTEIRAWKLEKNQQVPSPHASEAVWDAAPPLSANETTASSEEFVKEDFDDLPF